MDSSNGSRLRKNHPLCDALGMHKPYDLSGLQTYDLVSRPSKVFHDDLGRPVSATASVSDWLSGLPHQLAANDLRRVCDHVCRAKEQGRTIGAAVGGHVIKTGCAPYLIDWIKRGVLKAVALNGAAAIHDFELALAGKTSKMSAANYRPGNSVWPERRRTPLPSPLALVQKRISAWAGLWANTWKAWAAPMPNPA